MPREHHHSSQENTNGNHRKSHHHHHNHAKKHLKATSMAARKPTGDTKKLLTKTYSEIGMNSNHGNNNNNNTTTTNNGGGGGSPGTPTPSEKVSKWHRDILLVSPSGQTHPRQCICDQCMAEYGTYRIYNQLLDNPNSAVIKVSEEVQRQTEEEIVHREDMTKSDKVSKKLFFFTEFLHTTAKSTYQFSLNSNEKQKVFY